MASAADPDYVVTEEMEAEEAELAKKGKADDQRKLKAVRRCFVPRVASPFYFRVPLSPLLNIPFQTTSFSRSLSTRLLGCTENRVVLWASNASIAGLCGHRSSFRGL